MPINIPSSLPAKKILESENISTIESKRAMSQDIRPLKIVILNLMPKKIETETQLLRLLGNSPLQIDIELLQINNHISKNTSAEHLLKFYNTFDNIKNNKYDGLIITGAPVEHLEYEDVDYYKELTEILEWSKSNVYSTYHICWGAQAALNYHYNIKKKMLDRKMFGVFPHCINDANDVIVRGFDEIFYVPHSRYTSIDEEKIYSNKELKVLAFSYISGIHLVSAQNNRQLFAFGHAEYDRDTLANEYKRDIEKEIDIEIPYNYFPKDDPSQTPYFIWRAHANLLIVNWLTTVYQGTPFNLDDLSKIEIKK